MVQGDELPKQYTFVPAISARDKSVAAAAEDVLLGEVELPRSGFPEQELKNTADIKMRLTGIRNIDHLVNL